MASKKLISMHMVCVTLLFHVLIGIATASDYLDISGIRLANGTGPFGGRVEVSINGVWGTVCDDSFDMNDAKVMCRTMNLQATAYFSGAFYGQGIGPIFAQEFKCSGYEQHIKYCKFDVNVQCTHARDISIVCTECGEVDISNGYAKSISENGRVLTVACKTGFRSNIDTSVCEAGAWSVPSIYCAAADITDIRLANGIGLYDGRVELLMNGTWGTICSTSFSSYETRAICNILYGTTSYHTYLTSSYYYGEGTGPVHIDNLDCKGTVTDINECAYSLDVSCADHSRDVAVACRVFPLNITHTRLVNGTGPYDGRIELYVDGHWGTIDRRYVDPYDARTICNTHGGSLAMYFDTAIYGVGTGPILIRNIRCYAEKDTVNSCNLYAPYRSSSSHLYDLSIACTPCGLPDIYNGNPVAFNGTELTVTCHAGFFPNQIKMKCLNNNSWSEEQRCTPLYGFPLNISDIQLKNYYRPSGGRVEILVNGTWGTICDTNFASADARVICKMIGLEYSSYYTKASHSSGRGSGPIYVNNLNCVGTETHINLCSYEISNHCTHYDDVAVICTGYQLEITDIRLAGTNGPYHGRVELKVNGTWGTVCHDRFGWYDARAVCKIFRLTYRTYFYSARYGQGSGPIYIDRLDCPYITNTDYPLFDDCEYAVDNYYNCGHNEDVSVMCYGPTLNITAARLVNGTGPYDGRAEINVNGTWGTICDENFNIQAADLFCGLMGLRAAQYFTGAIYGEGSGPVFIDQLFCDNNDYSLSNCKYLFLNECTHGRDISVVCNDCGQPDIYFWGVDFFTYNGTTLFADCSYYRTYVGKLKLTCDNQTQTWNTEGECQEYRFPLDVTEIRMADGPSSTNGRVELKSLDTWGTVCDDYFGMHEANAICSMLGYPPAVTYFVGAHYGPGTGPIFVDDLSCGGDALHINNCTYITYDNCDHDDDVSVVCTDCGDPKPEHGFINSTFTNYGSAVHVTCEKDFNLIGDFEIICQLNGTWSNLPICKLIDCGNPRPSNGNINTTSTTNATVAMVWCDDGYTLIGDSVITCQSNETWTNYPVCQIIDCSDPEPDFADVTLLDNKTTFGETAVISCWTGYTPTTNILVSCLENGTWEEWPDCEIIDCDNPVPQKGSANSSETTYNTILQMTCGDGYNITGDSIIRCQADGTWSDYPRCDTSDCGQFSVANGEVNTSLGTITGSSATVVCDEGYDIQGSSVVICSSTGWNESVTCQVQVCPDPTPENGNVSDTDSIDEFVFGNYASIECDTGYEIDGDNVITCGNGGVWSNRPTCKLIDCGDLTAPINGNIDDSQGTKYSAKITFTCNEDFLLVGGKTSICGDNGKWNNQPPTCAAKSEVGGPCISQEYCLMEDSLCIDSVCACITGIYDIRTKKCDKMPLLPYGYGEGDYYIHETEVCGPTIFFPPGMPVSGKIRTNLYVCSYGFVSFDYQYTNPTPPKNKDSVLTIGQNTIIAPFYGPIDKKTSGPVYYRSYDILNSYNRMKDDADLISYVENIVVKFGDLESYEASFILIATWHETKALGIGFDTSKTSTFQAVLVSDGKSTYVFYIYGHGLMQWVDNDSNDTPVWVGVQVDTVDSLSSFTHPYAFTSQVLQLDLQPDVPKSEDDVAGLVFRPLHQQSVLHENAAVDCIRWYNENYEDKKHLDYIASLTPECPCDIWLSRFDPWFWKIGLHRRRKDISHYCVDMLHAGNFGKYGKSCCYDLRTWLWEYERPLAGGFQLYHPRYPLDHIVNDVIPKTKCCVKSNYCNLYYELRPTGSCYISSSYDFGTFWGDPHFITLDRMNFTFNGLGEYTLLRVRTNNLTFDLQARTERAIKQDGNLSDATVFSAFAVKDSSNASLHVEINKAKTGMILYGNNVDLTKQFYNSTDPENQFVYSPEDPTEGRYIISKRDETVSVVFTTSGISLNISVNVGMLSLNTGVPKGLKGLTSGLLGNYDGNPDNDFTMPNGTVLKGNLTEREVFEYGKTWSIDANDSAFKYDEDKSHFDFHNDSYVPRFLDEADPDKRAAAEKSCNGSQNIECVFDLVFTEKIEIADQTSSIKEESVSTKSELEVTVPSLTGCDVTFAEKGRNVSCNINVEYGNEIHFLENNVNATIDPASSVITYFQETDDPVYIRVSSKNEHGRFSPAFVVNIVHCTYCSGHGNCTNQTRVDSLDSDHFKYAQCVCEPQYQGNNCEEDFNGCLANPCSLQRNCTSLTAEEQKAQNRSYICGPCPAGFTDNTEDECIDVDECTEGIHTCEHSCTNREGSYVCSCNDGFRVDSRNNSKCKDVNECDHALHNCTHICKNTEGGFACQCYPGFKFDAATWSCTEDSDRGCNASERNACSNTSGCTVVEGKSECFCNDGYELDESKEVCKDIDECSRGVCPHDCVNTNGSFRCECFTGYRLLEPAVCTACKVPYWGKNCEQTCVCTGRGADRCDPVKGCICKAGWQGVSCDTDINECEASVEMCDDPRKICVNSLGSYSCVCRAGYHLTEKGDCEDIDECSDIQLNECMQECTNTLGSYSCSCRDGYTKNNETSCSDIDECALGTDKCEQRCTNNIGLYTCACHIGYTLTDDRQSCAKLSDPCLALNNLTCSHFCVLSEENAVCGCQKGYTLDSDNETCADKNECEDSVGNKCSIDATCINTAGSYECDCPVGKQLENDGRTCSECDDYHYGKNCLQSCSCLYGTCDKIKGCICDAGWAGNNCDIDINECDTGQVTCQKENTICVNLRGGATCSCKSGYRNNSGHCQDIDECDDLQLNSCDQQCVNSEGSYTCTCQKGFVLKGEKCTDIDECSGSHGCDQVCENTVGSYICSCESGFRLELTDRKSCKPENECNEEESKDCTEHASCYVNNGLVSCTCMKGFHPNGDRCDDIDECTADESPCSQQCNNTEGSFVCSCDVGYHLQEDRVTCRECNAWTYGLKCEQNCSCDKLKTEKCSPETGMCICKPGWNGTICDEDVNECKSDTACPNNSICDNADGSYECKCNKGYIKTGARHCEECDSRHFGDNCLEECTCSTENTKDCSHETGECKCKKEWTGINCTTDVDECEENENACYLKPNSTCRNIIGSFECVCNEGFVEDIGICKDINECLDSAVNNCEQICLNTPGGFECDCETGFDMLNGTCSDIDECSDKESCQQTCNNTIGSYTCSCEPGFSLNITDRKSCISCQSWTYGLNCTSNCSCEIPNTETCNAKNGDCSCKSGWNGTYCEADINECANQSVCPENSSCVNVNGSFDCTCDRGYSKTSDKFLCKECDDYMYGDDCLENCTCNVETTNACNNVNGSCYCKKGWEGERCSLDTNECSENVTLCWNKANSTCKNEAGSFRCDCNEGFREQDGFCTDCDQWQFGKDCESNCTCNVTKSEYCNQISGICVCKSGWNGTNCQDDVDECDIENICPDNSSCENTLGSFECKCNLGYTETDNGQCNDVDECNATETCHQICSNTIGSFTCSCKLGFSLNITDKTSCTSCQPWTYGQNCESKCNCEIPNTEICNATNGECTCKTGWYGTYCEDDINECANKSVCPENSLCVNLNGSFDCNCDRGYVKTDDKLCKECENFMYGDNCSQNCTCNVNTTHVCNNVNGSCYCKEGWEGELCSRDIDECSEDVTICQTKTNSTCENEDGSFRCECDDGFREQGDICTDCDQWKYGENCGSNCACDVNRTMFCDPKTGMCMCKSGWNGSNCQDDINECDIDDICPDNSSCENKLGSFECKCNLGYSENETGNCEMCDSRHYGDNCSKDCSCSFENTNHCNHITGFCNCLQGWKGDNCSVDINECESNEDVCKEKVNSTCSNTIGSYDCNCIPGFKEEENNLCEECFGSTYGENCSESCNCNATNTVNENQTCDKVTGSCKCKEGWNGDTCNDDVNECQNKTVCITTNNTTCVNTIGSFLCDCVRGFIKDTGGICVEDVRVTTQKPGISFDHTITVDTDLPSGTNLDSANTFNRLQQELKLSLLEYFNRYISAIIDLIINDIRSGSIKVDYTIVYGEKAEDVASKLTKAVLDLEQGAEISLYGENVTASSDVYKEMKPCEVYNLTAGGCDEGYQCNAENGTPTCRPIEDESEVNWSLVIGLSAVGLFLVIIVAVTVVFLRHLSRRQKIRKHRTPRVRTGMFGHSPYEIGPDAHKVRGWQRGNSADTESRIPSRRNKLSGTSSFSSHGNNPAYSQPFHIP